MNERIITGLLFVVALIHLQKISSTELNSIRHREKQWRGE